MGTRSVIGVMMGDVCKAVYCHWDGYISHNGVLLHRFYDSVKANQLIAMGNISSLGVEIGDKHEFSARVPKFGESGFNAYCTFYNRDRDEDEVFTTLTSWEDFVDFFTNDSGAEYAYIMRDGVWYTCNSKDTQLVLLSDAIVAEQMTEDC